MKIQLVIFSVAGLILSHANALGDGLSLNPKNLYEQISSQVRVPLRAETSAVRSVIDTMKDLQQKLQSDQLRSTYEATRPLRSSQAHQQSYQESSSPLNIRREELIQIREHQVVPSQQSGVNAGEAQLNRNSQDVHRQVYQNKQQVEKFNQELSYITTPHPVHHQSRQQEKQGAFSNPSTVSYQQSKHNNQHRYVFPQSSIDKRQETVVQRSFKQETVIPKQSNDGRQEPISSKSIHQQEINVQRSNQNQQDFNTQRFNNQNQQDFNTQRFNNNQNQQDFNTQRFNNQNQQDFNTQRFNNNQNQQDFNAQRFNNQNQQRQYQSEDKLSARQAVDNDGYRVAIPQPFQENRPTIVSYDLFNRNIELNGQRSYHASNQLNQAYPSRDTNDQPRKSSEREQQQFRFESNKPNLSSENVFAQNNENEKSKYSEVLVSGPVPVVLNVASNIKGSSFTRQHPFTVFNHGHLL